MNFSFCIIASDVGTCNQILSNVGGIPVVGTRVCGTNEAITDGLNGRLVAAQDSVALANAVIEALRQPGLTARWVHAGRTRFEQEFSAARMAEETAALYEELCAEAQSNGKGERAEADFVSVWPFQGERVTE